MNPTPQHTGLARDVIALLTAQTSGNDALAGDIAEALVSDPDGLPFVLGTFSSLVGMALATPADVTPRAFLAACAELLDAA